MLVETVGAVVGRVSVKPVVVWASCVVVASVDVDGVVELVAAEVVGACAVVCGVVGRLGGVVLLARPCVTVSASTSPAAASTTAAASAASRRRCREDVDNFGRIT